MCMISKLIFVHMHGLFVCLHSGWKGGARARHRGRWSHAVRPGWSSGTQRSQGYICLFVCFILFKIRIISLIFYICFCTRFGVYVLLSLHVLHNHNHDSKCPNQCKCIFICREITVYQDLLEFKWVFGARQVFWIPFTPIDSTSMDAGAIHTRRPVSHFVLFPTGPYRTTRTQRRIWFSWKTCKYNSSQFD